MMIEILIVWLMFSYGMSQERERCIKNGVTKGCAVNVGKYD